jgi:hypothetical protein
MIFSVLLIRPLFPIAFTQVLATSPPNLFMSSFNEHIGGRQPPSCGANTCINMGLPNDPQRAQVWVDVC